ncbi:uncharacterized protein LOC111889055 [Lactuca sativa]|uniref:uncharacterized protein LOC111889055 n=1 Tax=Lactuca sativa TaxID=4236 RepID=UPI000CD8C92C|nr:uncharacterized protein LOC111889055 [Lactuca sativa]
MEAAIWAGKSIEEMIKGRAVNKVEVGEKRKFEGSARSNKKIKSGSRKFGGGGSKAKCCEMWKKKHFEKCSEEVTCYRCGKTWHYANECTTNKRVCYGYNEEGHISKYFPKKKEVAEPNVPPKPKPRAFQMTMEAKKDVADVASGTFLVNGLAVNILFDSGANYSFVSHRFGGRLAVLIEKLENALVVEVVSGKFIPVSDYIKNVVIDLNGNEFHKELLTIELNGFVIILGMDWLSAIDAEILCKKKIVRVNPLGKESFMVYEDKCKVNSEIISLKSR